MGTKEDYQEKVEAELESSGDQIETWSAKADEAEGDARIEYEQHLDLLRDIQSRAQVILEELKQAGEESWENVRARLDGVRSELRNAILNVSSRFE